MATLTGLDALARNDFAALRGKSLAVVCNQASIANDFSHILELLLPLHRSGFLTITKVFGPQHGLFGHTQDNMIEWEGTMDARIGLRIYSLYGEHREPSGQMLRDVDLLLIDLPDVGSRYYTFIWTMAGCLRKCAELGIPATVLDRPNPIGGQVEGTVLDPGFASFVGLHPLPMRHAMTVGEVATYLRQNFLPSLELEVVPMTGWSRSDYFDDTGLPWAMPSPNMPTVDTAVIYPGGCLLEGTNLSEGRGTTRPFETFGAPWLDGWKLASSLNALGLKGCHFRPIQFQPTFQKHAGQLCEGAFLHVTDRSTFEPVITYVAIMQQAIQQGRFEWKQPPYEYETVKLPIDILSGNSWLRGAIEGQEPLTSIRERFIEECSIFESKRQAALLY